MELEIGTWHEREARELTHCPSYYAADHETMRTVPGEYPVRVTFEGGYTVPMPQWVLVSINALRVSGKLYSGFGGVNYASTDLPAGESTVWRIQSYVYQLKKLVEEGWITLHAGFEWLTMDMPWTQPQAPKTFEAVQKLREERTWQI